MTAAEALPVMELRPGLKDVRRPQVARLHHAEPAVRAPHRRSPGPALGTRRTGRRPAARSTPSPPHVAVWRSVRVHGEIKTEQSRCTLGLPAAAVQALRAWSGGQAGERHAAGDGWQDTGLVFTSHLGAALDAGNVQKMFKRICTEAGAGDGWTPRELRTTFVSLMSHQGVAIEEIARLAGHATPGPPRSSTAANCGPSSPPAPRSWTSFSERASLVPGRESLPIFAAGSHPLA